MHQVSTSVSKNVWRVVRKICESGQFSDEDDVIDMMLRSYIENNTDFSLETKPPTIAFVAKTVMALKPDLTKMHVASIRLFGSVLRGTATAQSDIDFLVDLHPDNPDGILRHRKVEEFLEDRFDRSVDVVPHAGMNRHWKDNGFAPDKSMLIF